MRSVKCFMLTPTERCYRWLRRYESGPCNASPATNPAYSYHNAMTRIEDGKVKVENREFEGIYGGERKTFDTEPHSWPHDDIRWPKRCPCGYAFPDSAEWQLSWDVIYVDAAGKEYTIHASHDGKDGVATAPAGAMWYAEWMGKSMLGPDGKCLVVRCPAKPDWSGVSDWMADGPSITNPAPAWSRQGIPPDVTATPSIFVSPPNGWHGFLRGGCLVDA